MRFGRKECGRHSGSSPMMLLHRPRGTGSVGREELARRADDFAHGRFSLLLRGGKSRSRIATVHPRCSRHLRAPRQGSTESCGAAPGFPRTTRVGWRKFGSKDAGNTRRVAREEAPTASATDTFRRPRIRPRTSIGVGFQPLHKMSARGLLPFVSATFAQPAEYLWEDAAGVRHTIRQAEGGEQGDPLKPLLFSLSVHDSLVEVHRSMQPGEHLGRVL